MPAFLSKLSFSFLFLSWFRNALGLKCLAFRLEICILLVLLPCREVGLLDIISTETSLLNTFTKIVQHGKSLIVTVTLRQCRNPKIFWFIQERTFWSVQFIVYFVQFLVLALYSTMVLTRVFHSLIQENSKMFGVFLLLLCCRSFLYVRCFSLIKVGCMCV